MQMIAPAGLYRSVCRIPLATEEASDDATVPGRNTENARFKRDSREIGIDCSSETAMG